MHNREREIKVEGLPRKKKGFGGICIRVKRVFKEYYRCANDAFLDHFVFIMSSDISPHLSLRSTF